jgi:hypothetical protein
VSDLGDAITHEANVAGSGIADLIELARVKDWPGMVKRSIELGLDLVPAETLRGYLEEAAVRRVKMATNAALDAKFGGEE